MNPSDYFLVVLAIVAFGVISFGAGYVVGKVDGFIAGRELKK